MMNENSIIVQKGCITIMLENKNSFPVDRKKAYIKAFCETLNNIEEKQLWDVFMILQGQIIKALEKSQFKLKDDKT